MRIATAIRSLILGAAVSAIPAASFAGIFVSIGIGAPPVLPVYAQPICPAAGYIWTPGYWAYDEEAGYYWVPGAWVLAPYTGALWTPGYWGYESGGYGWHSGYWGRHVGFYGGVNYGFGYFGHGFEGGYWDHDRFNYNRSVMNVNVVNVHNVYERPVSYRANNRVSFNGGRGGIQERPNTQEQAFNREQHTAPLPAQHQLEMRSSQDRQQFASVNHGRPVTVARPEPVSVSRNMPTVNRNMPVNNSHQAPVGMPNRNLAAPNANAQRPISNMNGRQPYAAPQANSYGQPNNQTTNRAPASTYAARPQGNLPTNQARPTYNQPRAQVPNSYRPEGNGSINQARPTYSQQPRMQAPQQQMRQAPQQQMRAAPQQQMRQAPQQSRPEPSHGGGGHDGGHGGRGR